MSTPETGVPVRAGVVERQVNDYKSLLILCGVVAIALAIGIATGGPSNQV